VQYIIIHKRGSRLKRFKHSPNPNPSTPKPFYSKGLNLHPINGYYPQKKMLKEPKHLEDEKLVMSTTKPNSNFSFKYYLEHG
jgi:hypothetical protein